MGNLIQLFQSSLRKVAAVISNTAVGIGGGLLIYLLFWGDCVIGINDIVFQGGLGLWLIWIAIRRFRNI